MSALSASVANEPMKMPYPPLSFAGFTTISSRLREDVAAVQVVDAEEGLHAGDQRILAEVVADDVGHVGVHGLVVGDARTGSVGDRDVARTPRPDEPGNPQASSRA